MKNTLIEIVTTNNIFELPVLFNQYETRIREWNDFLERVAENGNEHIKDELEDLTRPEVFDIENFTNGMETTWILLATKVIKDLNMDVIDKIEAFIILGYNEEEVFDFLRG